MPKIQKSSRGLWHIAIVLTGTLGFLGVLGELEITRVGRAIYAGLKGIFGSIAWGVPIILLIVTAVLAVKLDKASQSRINKGLQRPMQKREHNQREKRKSVHERTSQESIALHEEKKGIPLPKSKLISLQGFEEYFASDEGPKIESAAAEEPLPELGRNFTTYFQEGNEFSFKPLSTQFTSNQTLKGFPSYFEYVQSEFEQELIKSTPVVHRNPISEKRVPGQLAHLTQYLPQLKMEEEPKNDFSNVQESNQEVPYIESQTQYSEPSSFIEKLEIELDEVKIENGTESDNERCDKTDLDEIKEEISESLLENPVNSTEISQGVPNPGTSRIMSNSEIVRDISSEMIQEVFDEDVDSELVDSVCEDSECVEMPHLQSPKSWSLPELELLDPFPNISVAYDPETQKKLEQVLTDFNIKAKVIRVTRGPVITRFELVPAPGVKISRIVNLADDIALGLAARDVRIEAPIPGKAAIGIEVPNKQPRPVPFREVLETATFKENTSKLKTALGKDISNQPVIADLAKMPHVLIAGATGSGKSVCITTIINSILFNAQPNEVKFLMVDPKMVELSIYNGIPHLLAPVVTDPKKAAAALKWIVKEMETRYELFAAAGVRDIGRYNRLKASSEQDAPVLPWIVVIIDELADLMMVAANDVEEAICRLAQMARAAGIHLVIATQRPSVDVITGVIKANIPSRVSFAVSSQIDSRTILDATGAEKLLGRGDMLYSPQGINKPIRVQGCFVSDDEVQRAIDYWKTQGKPEYLAPEGFFVESDSKTETSGPDDELFAQAGRLIINMGMASVSFLQRKLKLGYARAARLMDLLEENDVVGGYEGSKPRHILMTIEEFDERFG